MRTARSLFLCFSILAIAVGMALLYRENVEVKESLLSTKASVESASEQTGDAETAKQLAGYVNTRLDNLEDEVLCGEIINRDSLPEDAHAYHLTVITSDNWRNNPNEAYLLSWFEQDKQLKSLKSQLMFHHYTTSQEICGKFKGYYQTANGQTVLPTVFIQTSTGVAVYKESGNRIPRTSRKLMYQIRSAFRNCPDCRPRPDNRPNLPNTVVINTNTYPVVPDTTDYEAEARRKRLAEERRRKAEEEKKKAEEGSDGFAIAICVGAVGFILTWVLLYRGSATGGTYGM